MKDLRAPASVIIRLTAGGELAVLFASTSPPSSTPGSFGTIAARSVCRERDATKPEGAMLQARGSRPGSLSGIGRCGRRGCRMTSASATMRFFTRNAGAFSRRGWHEVGPAMWIRLCRTLTCGTQRAHVLPTARGSAGGAALGVLALSIR